jgi:transglutaminase-like putative cysteine protease
MRIALSALPLFARLALVSALPTLSSGCQTDRGPAVDRPISASISPQAPSSRSFSLTYAAQVTQVPAGTKRLDLWLPVPQSDPRQTISAVRVESPFAYEFTREAEYGNRILHAWSDKPAPGVVRFTCDCTRFEALPLRELDEPAPSPRFLQPDRLGIIDTRIRALAAQLTAGKAGAQDKAKAIYDYVVSTMAYDKTTPGWGNGDTSRACDVRKGNCTDFHALFISLARASGIPARFEIGFPLPADKIDGALEGYHCWAEFWDSHAGWVPVDCSEAWKHPPQRSYYFGSLDPHRIQLSAGRDVTLPGMHGTSLNYLLNPYLELDAKPSTGLAKVVSFSSSVH